MKKSNVILKITGILMLALGILGIGVAVLYGFTGAEYFQKVGQEVLPGLLIFYGLLAIVVGFVQTAAGAFAIRHARKLHQWLRTLIFALIALILGIAAFLTFGETTSRIHVHSSFYPEWYTSVLVLANGIILPALMVVSSIISKVLYNKNKKEGMRAMGDELQDVSLQGPFAETDEMA